jgi:4-hydroxy-3-polyprenylbenzoate decarboxylase
MTIAFSQNEAALPVTPNGLPLVVGITGASGSILGFTLVKALLGQQIPVELVLTEKSHQVVFEELQYKVGGGSRADKSLRLLAYLGLDTALAPLLRIYQNCELDAPASSGTHLTRGMVVIPCSMGTLGRISHGISDKLVSRAADVAMKEGRKLILLPRESPFNRIHLQNMLRLNEMGVVILPPMLTFYLPSYHSMEGQIGYIVGKTLDHLGIQHQFYERWAGSESAMAPSDEATVDHVLA